MGCGAASRGATTLCARARRLELAIRGVLAGNIFDLGAAASAERFASGASSSSSFTATRNSLLPRPWAVDDLDAALDRLAGAVRFTLERGRRGSTP